MIKKFFEGSFFRFVLVGVVNTAFGAGIMFLFYNCLHLSYWISSASNYVFGSILSYFLNNYYTFRYKKRDFKTVLRFVLNVVVCYFVAYGVAKPLVYALNGHMSISARDNIAMLAGMVIFTILNYFGQKLFAFRKTDCED